MRKSKVSHSLLGTWTFSCVESHKILSSTARGCPRHGVPGLISLTGVDPGLPCICLGNKIILYSLSYGCGSVVDGFLGVFWWKSYQMSCKGRFIQRPSWAFRAVRAVKSPPRWPLGPGSVAARWDDGPSGPSLRALSKCSAAGFFYAPNTYGKSESRGRPNIKCLLKLIK